MKPEVRTRTERNAGPVTAGSSRQPQVVQLLGSNIKLRSAEKRYLETVNKGSRLRVDPDNDAYLEGLFNEAIRPLATDSDLTDNLMYLLNYFKSTIPYNKAGKISAFDEHRQGEQKIRNLGTMLHANAATCWEKAAFFNLVLAEMGIKSQVEGGYGKEDGGGHAWIVLQTGGSKDGWIMDPTWGVVSPRSFYEKAYNITVKGKALAFPKVRVDAAKLSTAINEMITLSPKRSINVFKTNSDDLFQRARVELVGLKVDRDKRKEETSKLLSGLVFKM